MTDAAGLAALYEQHVGAMVTLATALTGDRDGAEDLAHDCFVRVASRLGVLGDDVRFGSYLRRAVVNACRSRFRRERLERAVLRREGRSASVPGPETAVTEAEAIRVAVMALPYRQRAAVILRFAYDLSEEEVAEALGCSRRAVNSLVSRAMVTLRAHVSGEEDG
jgi:RNA polymerase sigma factor (sigma-70 family)